jgi:hypothetical protein
MDQWTKSKSCDGAGVVKTVDIESGRYRAAGMNFFQKATILLAVASLLIGYFLAVQSCLQAHLSL